MIQYRLPTPELLPADAISLRRRHGRNQGDIDSLAADISDRGLRHPLTVTAAGMLVLGARRYPACIAAGMTSIPCRKVGAVAQALDIINWENGDDERSGDSKYHLPATIAALGIMDVAIRQLSWWPRGDDTMPGRMTDHRSALAAALDSPGETGWFNTTQYTRLHAVALAADGWQVARGGERLRVAPATRDAAREALALLDHRDLRQVTAVHHRWHHKQPLTEAPLPPLSPRDVRSLAASVQGFIHAAGRAGLPGEDVTADEAADLDLALSTLIRTLSGYRTRLRQASRTSAGSDPAAGQQ